MNIYILLDIMTALGLTR